MVWEVDALRECLNSHPNYERRALVFPAGFSQHYDGHVCTWLCEIYFFATYMARYLNGLNQDESLTGDLVSP
jgi:hypothetical protein